MSAIATVIACAARQNLAVFSDGLTIEPDLATCACGAQMRVGYSRCALCQIRADDADPRAVLN
jgi:hypothetical protein